ncbi:hypothetical protein AB2B38_008500 [Balneola sp. MJW-20]|uniref:hypothetical protein n=1 Tax=Gracilimonas aurantiaca TaxID=3234185 RepID=UPI003467DD4E
MKKSIVLSVLVCLGMSLSAYAQGATKIVDEFPAFFPPLTMCNGESVIIEGIATVITTIVNDSNGGLHRTQKIRFDASGIGSEGNEYTLVGYTSNTSYNGTSGAENRTRTLSYVIKDNIKGKNYRYSGVVHFTVNSNGVLVSEFLKDNTPCE